MKTARRSAQPTVARRDTCRAAARRGACRALVLAFTLAGLALPALAQYRVVGPDGRVTYTDRPPADASSRVTPLQRTPLNEQPAPDALPSELRRLSTRYPVTLYAAADCAPCDSARQLLQQRGVPFTEKLIVTESDAQAMDRLMSSRTVPSLTIGTQALSGLSAPEWNAYLDAAGYPRESQLPKGWQAAPAAPLAPRPPARAQAAPEVAATPAARAPAAAPPAPPPQQGSIRF